jgi:gliding motility-associated-like protein
LFRLCFQGIFDLLTDNEVFIRNYYSQKMKKNDILLLFTLFLSIVFWRSSSGQTLSFVNAPGSPDACGTNPRGIQTADLNHDGILDLVVGYAYNSQMEIWLGVGNGSFVAAPGSPITASVSGPISIAIGDFNGDTHPDLVVANYNGGGTSIYLGAGNGSFTQASGSPLPAGGFSYYVITADFNADGKLDLAEVDESTDDAYIYLGNGNGTFTSAPSSPFLTNFGPICVVSSDFNGDSKADLAILSSVNNDVSILLGNGNGTFTAAPGGPITVGSFPRIEALSDFNGDGKMDIAVTNLNSNTVNILLGSGTGLFSNAAGSPFTVGAYPYSVNPADFNGDGKMDIAVSSGVNSDVEVYYGSGNGSFTLAPGAPFATGNDTQSMILGDYNGDGAMDIATANYGSSNVSVLINKLTTFTPTSVFQLATGNSGCMGQQIAFANSSTGSPTVYSWTFGDGGTSISKNTIHTYLTAGTYTVSLTVSNGAGSNTSSQVISIFPLPAVTVAYAGTTCAGISTLLTAAGAVSYAWTPVASLSSATGNQVGATPSSTTLYTVTGTSVHGCINTDTIRVIIYPSPSITISAGITSCANHTTLLTAAGASSYSWAPLSSLSSDTGYQVSAKPSSPTTYTLTGVSAHGCIGTETVTVSFTGLDADLRIPNVFTPNGDGVNDLFLISGFADCGDYKLSVFDRWGRTIYTTSNPQSDSWNGKDTDGNQVTDGVYFYLLSESSQSWKGYVNLLR